MFNDIFAEPEVGSGPTPPIVPESIWPLDITTPRFVDTFGNMVGSIEVGQQVQVAADLKNKFPHEQQFTYAVQITNESGETSLSWITASLTDAQTFSSALSWFPEIEGYHFIEFFFFDSINNLNVLYPPVYILVDIGDLTDMQVFNDNTVSDIELTLIIDEHNSVIKILSSDNTVRDEVWDYPKYTTVLTDKGLKGLDKQINHWEGKIENNNKRLDGLLEKLAIAEENENKRRINFLFSEMGNINAINIIYTETIEKTKSMMAIYSSSN